MGASHKDMTPNSRCVTTWPVPPRSARICLIDLDPVVGAVWKTLFYNRGPTEGEPMRQHQGARMKTPGGQRRPGRLLRGRGWVAVGAAAAVFAPAVLTWATTGPASAAPSNIHPNRVLKYGYDLNNEFSNSFDTTGLNDCSYTATANIFQSMTAPGNFAISGGVAQSWTVSN